MAVYTIIEQDKLQLLLEKYDVGQLKSYKGITEGVENTNYLIETNRGEFIFTLYENRVNKTELPFFFDLLDHLHKASCPVPRFIAAKDGSILQNISGKPACLIEFLSGSSVQKPNIEIAASVGETLAKMHSALHNYSKSRFNDMSLTTWHKMADKCSQQDMQSINKNLYPRIKAELLYLNRNWPKHLPQSIIHGDLFPDNVLITNNKVSGMIDFYFAATDIKDYDIAVTHAAWCFSLDGKIFYKDISDAFLKAYNDIHPFNDESIKHWPTLCRGASLRFLLSRTVDWINTPADALVTKKDPMAFMHRLDYYSDSKNINHILSFKG